MTNIQDMTAQVEALDANLGQSTQVVADFESELSGLRKGLAFTGREVNSLSHGIGTGLRRAFDGLVFDGMKLSDAMEVVARSMSNAVYRVSMRPVQTAVSGALAQGLQSVIGAALPFARGGAVAQGRVMPFARGGVVSGPTPFGLRGATGLMGEAGPEAILPLTRGPDGRLGVQAQGGAARPVTVVMNITTPDVQGFQRSQAQIAAQVSQALAQGQRNM